jgi:hypothetical protein
VPTRPRPYPRLVGPKLIPLLRIQGPAIVECRGGWLINPITSSIITNRVNRSTCREPLAFERNTISLYFNFRDIGANKLNVYNILT